VVLKTETPYRPNLSLQRRVAGAAEVFRIGLLKKPRNPGRSPGILEDASGIFIEYYEEALLSKKNLAPHKNLWVKKVR